MKRLTRRTLLVGMAAAPVALAVGVVAVAAQDTGSSALERLAITRAVLRPGDQLIVTATFRGGVDSAVLTYRKPDGGTLTLTLYPVGGENYSEGAVTFTLDDPEGVYRVERLELRGDGDRVLRRLTLESAPFAVTADGATVTITTSDVLAAVNNAPTPVPAAVAAVAVAEPLSFFATSVSNPTIRFGGSFTTRVIVRGPARAARVTYAYPGGDVTRSMFLRFAGGDLRVFETTFSVTGDLPPGRYVITSLAAVSESGVALNRPVAPDEPLVAPSAVNVIGANPNEPPRPTPTATALLPDTSVVIAAANTGPVVFTDVRVEPPAALQGGLIAVTATIAFRAAKAEGQPVAAFSDGERVLLAYLFPQGGDIYRGNVTVPPAFPEGTYPLASLYAADVQGNIISLAPPATDTFRAAITVTR